MTQRENCRLVQLLASAMVIAAVTSTSQARAEAPQPCSQLPPIAWQDVGTINLSVLGLVGVELRQNPFVKDLYLQALCGVYPSVIWHLVDSGTGAVLEVPSGPESNLAAALDKVTPHLALTRYVYVRGGGPEREILVVLLTDGYEGPWFDVPDRVTPPDSPEVDNRAPWTPEATDRLQRQWNLLPYDFLRRATSRIHDYGRYQRCHQAKLRLQIAFGLIKIDIPFLEEMCDRGVANPFGTMIIAATREQPLSNAQVHETGHFVQFESSGHMGQLYLDGLTEISFENQRVLGIKVPYLFRKRHEEAQTACDQGLCQPYGFVSNYAACGSSPAEDFADTIVVAMGMTHGIWKNIHLPDHVPERIPSNYDANRESYPASDCYPSDSMHRLYSRAEDPDAAILAAKADYMYSVFSLSPDRPMDADGDGMTWTVGQQRGAAGVDCDDTNPVLGGCDPGSCQSVLDCVDDDFCTVESCREGWCVWPLLDQDDDGYPAQLCGGEDCDDDSSLINPDQLEVCDDGLDNDCTAGVDDPGAIDARDWYRDDDGDGYGGDQHSRSCQPPDSSWVHLWGDCNDSDASIYPGAPEQCGSPEDRNCDGSTSNTDADKDGYVACEDCDDSSPTTYPDAVEICDGRDNDCDQIVDDGIGGVGRSCNTGLHGICSAGTVECWGSSGLRCVANTLPGTVPETCDNQDNDCDGVVDNGVRSRFYRDADGDGFGDPGDSTWACSAPPGYVANDGDCYDRNAAARPGQSGWFAVDRGDGSFDYDCDDQQLMRYVDIAWCKVYVDHGEGGYGWKNSQAHCGQVGDYTVIGSGWWWWFGCGFDYEPRTQSCR